MWRVLSNCIDERISSGLREFSDIVKCYIVQCSAVQCSGMLCCVVLCCVVL